MMAAGRAAERGAKVLLLEKNKTLGKKLLITGGGRCNLTNNEPDVRKLLARYKGADKFLFSAFSQHSVSESLAFFHNNSMPTKEENDRRMFPQSNTAKSVWEVLVAYMARNKVEVRTGVTVKGFVSEGGKIAAVNTDKGIFEAKSYLLATGGKSHPETGSTGEGFEWLNQIGHTIVQPTSALVPIQIKDAWIKDLQGLALPDAKITVIQNEVKEFSKQGKILFTHFGLSGPAVLNMSKGIGELLEWDSVFISIDVFPNEDYGTLNELLLKAFADHSNKKFKNVMAEILPSKLAPVITSLSKIDPDKFVNTITRDERVLLTKLMKDLRAEVTGLLGEDKAIITSGGVALEEVDFKTMQSKIAGNLYLAGDVLNIDRPSGGFSLQLCWTTGFVAGNSAASAMEALK